MAGCLFYLYFFVKKILIWNRGEKLNYQIYKISGINEATNRKKSIKIDGLSEDDAIESVLKQGLKEISNIEIIPFDVPTERQLDYAKSLGLIIPNASTKEDVSALISKRVDRDSTPNPGLLEFATNKRIFLSNYIGKTALYEQVFSRLVDKDKIAFFAFSIYRYISDDRHANLDTHSGKALFYEFADSVISDESFMKSMNRYNGSDLKFFGEFTTSDGWTHTGGSVDSLAFKQARGFLIEKQLIKENDPYRTKRMRSPYRDTHIINESSDTKETKITTIYENENTNYANVSAKKKQFELPKYELPVVISILVMLLIYIFVY